MLVNSQAQRKAHEELDRVIGRHRLPGHVDIKHLPYIAAIVKETLRHFPNAPLAIPH